MNSELNSSYDRFIGMLNALRKAYKDLGLKNVTFGDFTYTDESVRLNSDALDVALRIGKFCSIARGVTIVLGGEHRTDWITTFPFNALCLDFNYIKGHPKSKGDIIIGNDVWIGSDAKILSGVTIGDGCVVGSSALVTKDMPPYSIWGGNPARFIRYRFEQEIIDSLMRIKWWDWSYRDVFNVIPILQSDNFPALFQYYEENIVVRNQ